MILSIDQLNIIELDIGQIKIIERDIGPFNILYCDIWFDIDNICIGYWPIENIE